MTQGIFPTPAQANDLQNAFQLLQQGHTAAALQHVDRVLLQSPKLVDGLHLKGLILKQNGSLAQAEAVLRQALKLAPHHGDILNSLGTLLSDTGQHEDALAAMKAALESAPNKVDIWINTGIIATQTRRFDIALKSLEYATAAAPDNHNGWCALGVLHNYLETHDAAIAALQRALQLQPKNLQARYNLAVALRMSDRLEEALLAYDQAITDGLTGPAALTGRAHVLAELSRYAESVDAYRQVTTHYPLHVDAHDALARTLPQIDPDADPLESYARALVAEPHDPHLWRAALSTARELKAHDRQLEWAEIAEKNLGAHTDFDLARAGALLMLDDQRQAEKILDHILEEQPIHGGAHNFMAHMMLKKHDAEKAAHHATEGTRYDPLNQSGWAYLATAWRLLQDPREQWLTDYENHVSVIDLEGLKPPEMPGALSDWFSGALSDELLALHATQHHPTEQSLRNGTQTRGLLFSKRLPGVQQLQQLLRRAVGETIRNLPDDTSHPFLSRKPARPEQIRFSGSWSVRLRASGFHISHIHPMGWMSSACYISLPPEMGNGDGEAGALTFGVPDATLGLDLPPRRIVKPKAGQLVLFPSFMWHGTVPFQSSAHRMTVAFDVVPM
jgi:tetratricopeptide (TPR) repeat protein